LESSRGASGANAGATAGATAGAASAERDAAPGGPRAAGDLAATIDAPLFPPPCPPESVAAPPVSARGPRYTPIADYGVIGDLHTVALVGLNGSIDWYCPRSFDSPSVFAAMLDATRGGYCRVEPKQAYTAEQRYVRSTAVLITTFRTATGVVELTDFMPIASGQQRAFAEIHRRVRCLSGEVDMEVAFAPRFDYAACPTHVHPRRQGLLATDAEDEVLTLAGPAEIWWAVDGGMVTATLRLSATTGWTSPERGDAERPRGAEPHRPSRETRRARSRMTRAGGVLARIGSAALRLSGAMTSFARGPGGGDADAASERDDGDTPGAIWLVVRYDDDEVRPLATYESARKLDATVAFWDEWVAAIRYAGPHRVPVLRSAVTLKLMCYEPTGAIVAAPTTSLPEEMGGVRNWDYRFSWIRDSAFVLYSLSILGHSAEADRFMEFLKRVARRTADTRLQVMYGIDGRRHLTEQILPHLEGYGGSAPVRIGNAAYDQLQLDVYGELLETTYLWSRTRPLSEGTWVTLERLINWVADNWRRPDSGIWEVRAGLQHYVLSKVMCWVTLDRGIRMAREFGLAAPLERWEAERAAVHADVLANGWSEAKRSFVQYYGTEALDASNLVIPMVGFLPHSDQRVIDTVAATIRELTSADGELVYRYRNPDGLPGEEGVFSICTFWLAEALALCGQRAHGERIFHRMLRHANHLGLYSEEMNPETGEFLGNFPQAFTHIALINCAHVLERTAALDGRD